MQYQLLGVSSGFSAHMLSTLLASWRRMLRAAAITGALGIIAVEALALTITHQFPPTLPTNAVALAFGFALAYGAAASIFARELLRGALRALTLLQDGAGALMGATAVAARATGPRAASATPLPLSAARMPSDASLPQVAPAHALRGQPAPLRHSGGQPSAADFPAQTPLPPRKTPPGTDSQPYRFIEDEPTRPVTIGEEDGATVMVLPEPLYSQQAMQPRVTPFAPPESQFGSARPVPDGISLPLPPLAQASPPPDLYAPWSEVAPIADPSARTELGTIAAQDPLLNADGVQAAIARGRWPRRVLRPMGSGHRLNWWSRGRGRAERIAS